MKDRSTPLLLITLLVVILNSCGPSETITPIPTSSPQPTSSEALKNIIIVVSNSDDSGSGSLREALMQAQQGDTILFDPAIFPPDEPNTIVLNRNLPPLGSGTLTLDGSDAGIILDGSRLTGNDAFGLDVTSSGNIIRGLQFTGFSGYAIGLFNGARDNLIGGDPSIGAGPSGQGNQIFSNGIGINIWDAETSRNTITGNFIGTNIQGLAGLGNNTGIYFIEGSDHTIGPDNVIAFNTEYGITITNPTLTGITITRNNIHSNTPVDLHLQEGANLGLDPPLVTRLGLVAGRIEGLTCPTCTVEVFSVQQDGSLFFETSSEADSIGSFVATSQSDLMGQELTLTATDPEGNTSAFSPLVLGATPAGSLQENNHCPLSAFVPLPANELADNRIGDMTSLRNDVQTIDDAAQYLDMSNQFGFKHKRLSLDFFDWSEVIASDPPAYSTFEVNPIHDQLITDLAQSGVTILYGLVFWDDQIDPEQSGYARFRIEEEVERYLDYVRFIVRHFRGRIKYYEILNESFFGPGDFTQQNIELDDYIEVVRRASEVIRFEDPDARVVVGSAPAMFDADCAAYQLAILSSDVIMPFVDAVAWHTGSYPVDLGGPINHLYRFPETPILIEETAQEHGFRGEFIAEELCWPTEVNPSPSTSWFMYSETIAAKYYGRSIVEHQARGHITSIAGGAYESGYPKMTVIANLATLLAGAEPIELDLTLESESDAIVAYAFKYKDGGLMLALWLDGFASDEAKIAVPATLTIPNYTQKKIIGVDILIGLQQQLHASITESGLQISDIFVRDYPIIILVPPT